ncbi:TlpA family protein disulfide reductase [Pedobacter cryoconitis]|uniref:Thiol-disulfide isomerase/thioredoxin n=1 Tax=Pedobacter cryoconitis TaxID=188932 RepID=A0A327SMT4_9SPHI|nr:TlpA disulfide reductase family protein [Pedobacter cryoconitis]RAJ29094.1 thiol-disulfide isomerase/thioredoxin [Pedobacter cryoconitis]
MKHKLLLLLLVCTISAKINAQPLFNIGLNIGDSAPPLKVKAWVKGKPIQKFEKGKIYVIDFWATWCIPCMALMPHFSKLAHKYQDKATFLSIDIYEKEIIPIAKIKKLVDSMANRMDFTIGIEENKLMTKTWADPSKLEGIPSIFIINDGKIDWIGHPKYADSVLTQILNKTWRPGLALIKRNDQLYLKHLEYVSAAELTAKIDRYKINMAGNTYDRVMISPDSVLLVINEMVRNVPSLKFLPVFVSSTFRSLLQTNPQKAYDFAREVMATHTYYDEPIYLSLVYYIEENSDSLKLPENIYRLGAECCQAWIDSDPYPEFGLTLSSYKRMANLYRHAGDLQKAAEAERKAKDFSLINQKLLNQ